MMTDEALVGNLITILARIKNREQYKLDRDETQGSGFQVGQTQ